MLVCGLGTESVSLLCSHVPGHMICQQQLLPESRSTLTPPSSPLCCGVRVIPYLFAALFATQRKD